MNYWPIVGPVALYFCFDSWRKLQNPDLIKKPKQIADHSFNENIHFRERVDKQNPWSMTTLRNGSVDLVFNFSDGSMSRKHNFPSERAARIELKNKCL